MATTITKPETLVGKRIRRREDPRLITGTATYVDDIKMPGMHHAVHRAQPARARPGSARIDTKAAARHSRRRRRLHRRGHRSTSARCPAALRCPACACRITTFWRTDRVYFVGHPVAVVVATDRYLARDAADLVEVDYEALPAVADPEKALAPGAPAVHPEWPDNVAFTFHQEGGDIDQAFARSRRGGQAAHHQPAPDSHRHGNARRGGRVARRRTDR